MHIHDIDGGQGVFTHAVMITGFVLVMMLMIEYLNVLTRGSFNLQLSKKRWKQYLLTTFLGATPGCLGAFAVSGMYSHRIISTGAMLSAMIATTGDEAFFMLAVMPRNALILTGAFVVVGIIVGLILDAVLKRVGGGMKNTQMHFEIHPEHCECFARGMIISQWKKCSAARGILAVTLMLFVLAVATGQFGGDHWNWIRITLLIVSSLAVFIVSTVPDHFLEEHLWKHVVLKHVPKLFIWTLSALTVMHIFTNYLHLSAISGNGKWIMLVIACLVGLIPESGPHLVFITLYISGAIPFGILVAEMFVQDGHGMLPLLADSTRKFVALRLLKLILGFIIGSILLVLTN